MTMIRVFPSLILIAAFLLVPFSRGQELPLRDGEHLRYRVSWAIVPGAGEIRVNAQQSATDPNRLVVTSTTATRGIAKMLLPFSARSESIFDARTGRLLSMHDTALTRGKPSEYTIEFDYTTREATFTRITPPQEPRALPMPDGDPTDLILGLLQTRKWDLKPGESRDALVLFDDDFYELTIHATRYEQIRTPAGTFNTVVLEPRMEKTAPKGMFRRGSTVRVWIAQDQHRLPVRFEVEFKIGTGTATLEAYSAPAVVTPAATATRGPNLSPGTTNRDAQNPRP
jgi:hypothetical protein